MADQIGTLADQSITLADRSGPIATARGRRLQIYGGSHRMEAAIKAVEGDDQVKSEILNALSVVVRLALILNDGGVSPQKLQNW